MRETTEETTGQWMERGGHLPRPLRDFHDQKDVFKSLHQWIGKPGERDMFEMPSWVDGQIYTIDYVLRFLAAHGWTLQRSRKRLPFARLSATVNERREREAALLREGFERLPPQSPSSRAPSAERSQSDA